MSLCEINKTDIVNYYSEFGIESVYVRQQENEVIKCPFFWNKLLADYMKVWIIRINYFTLKKWLNYDLCFCIKCILNYDKWVNYIYADWCISSQKCREICVIDYWIFIKGF